MVEQIMTTEELDTLPIGSVVVDRDLDAWLRDGPEAWVAAESAPFRSARILRFGPFRVVYRPDLDPASHDRQVAERAGAEAVNRAWTEGHKAGWEHCQDGNYGNDYWDDDTPNPYRADALAPRSAAPGVSVSAEQRVRVAFAIAESQACGSCAWPSPCAQCLADADAAIAALGVTVTDGGA